MAVASNGSGEAVATEQPGESPAAGGEGRGRRSRSAGDSRPPRAEAGGNGPSQPDEAQAEGERAPRKRRRRRRGKPVDGASTAGNEQAGSPSQVPATRQGAAPAVPAAEHVAKDSFFGRIGRRLRSLVGGN